MGNTRKAENLSQKSFEATQDVAITARELRKDNPDLSWGECVRIAEKWKRENR